MKQRMKINESLLVVILGLLISTVVMVRLTVFQPSYAERTIQDYAQEKGISPREYPDSLVKLLEQNPETESFVLNYPFRGERPIDLKDIDRSQGVPLLLQWDPRWGYEQYGNDFVAITGSAPLCLSMAGWYLTGDALFSPDEVIRFANDNGYSAKGSGSKWTLISEGGTTLGLSVKELPLVEQKITDYLKAGNIIIAVVGSGDFTRESQFIVLTGYKNGAISVNDPNSLENSDKTWTYQQLESQINNLWLIQARENG